jgi:hypothetical protein
MVRKSGVTFMRDETSETVRRPDTGALVICDVENISWVSDGIFGCIDDFVVHLNEQKSTAENGNGSSRVRPSCFVSLSMSSYVSQDLAGAHNCICGLDNRGANLNINCGLCSQVDAEQPFTSPFCMNRRHHKLSDDALLPSRSFCVKSKLRASKKESHHA